MEIDKDAHFYMSHLVRLWHWSDKKLRPIKVVNVAFKNMEEKLSEYRYPASFEEAMQRLGVYTFAPFQVLQFVLIRMGSRQFIDLCEITEDEYYKIKSGPRWPSDISDFPNVDWRSREAFKTMYAYRPVPWFGRLKAIEDHFAHISEKDPCLIAYTQDENKGKRNIQTPIKPGRYLTKFYPELDANTVKYWAGQVDSVHILKFAKSEQEIIRVYERGPNSCMKSGDGGKFLSHIHPVAVYANSDLQLAYLEDTKRITARCLVWPEKKLYGRVYGDETRLIAALTKSGFTAARHWDLSGAKIRRIKQKDAVFDGMLVMPYIDGHQRFDIVDENWCVINREGKFNASRTCGLALAHNEVCKGCNTYFEDISRIHLYEDDLYCASCHNAITMKCGCCGNPFGMIQSNGRIQRHAINNVYVDDSHNLGDRERWCDECTDKHAFYCVGSGLWFKKGVFESIEIKGRIWEKSNYERHEVFQKARRATAGFIDWNTLRWVAADDNLS